MDNDKYFYNKAEGILRILNIKQNIPDLDDEEYNAMVILLSFNLKEIARDQKQTCAMSIAENCLSNNLPENFPYTKVEHIIFNSEIVEFIKNGELTSDWISYSDNEIQEIIKDMLDNWNKLERTKGNTLQVRDMIIKRKG